MEYDDREDTMRSDKERERGRKRERRGRKREKERKERWEREREREREREVRRKRDKGMEIVTAVEGKYEGMLEKRGEREAHGERRLWREGGGSMRTG